MSNFLNQIKEDIEHIQKDYYDMDDRLRDESYAYNYWLLKHLFNIDEENIKDCVTDRSGDRGIDAYVYYEYENILYLIQNKHWADGNINPGDITKITETAIMCLENGEYWHSGLQSCYDKMKQKENYKIHAQFYVANKNQYSDIVLQTRDSINNTKEYVDVELFSLDQMENIYFGKRYKGVQEFRCTIKDINNDREMKMTQANNNTMINARYYAIPISQIYHMQKTAQEQNYELFDENIRDFLGFKGKQGRINKAIVATLKDPENRRNFFYYNNGITILCDKLIKGNKTHHFEILNPKIINGCQTTNSIVAALSEMEERGENINFKSTYVFVKIFEKETPATDTEDNEQLYKNIVIYTNSQNVIKPEDLIGMEDMFLSLQKEMKNRGFLLLVKQSDKNQFKEKLSDEEFVLLKEKAYQYTATPKIEINKQEDLHINLIKFLRGMLAFYNGAAAANNSSDILRMESKLYREFTAKIGKIFTVDSMIWLHLLFKKAEGYDAIKRESDHLPYLLMDFFGRDIRNKFNLSEQTELYNKELKIKVEYLFSSNSIFEKIFEKYKQMEKTYIQEYKEDNECELDDVRKSSPDDKKMKRMINSFIQLSGDEDLIRYIE